MLSLGNDCWSHIPDYYNYKFYGCHKYGERPKGSNSSIIYAKLAIGPLQSKNGKNLLQTRVFGGGGCGSDIML